MSKKYWTRDKISTEDEEKIYRLNNRAGKLAISLFPIKSEIDSTLFYEFSNYIGIGLLTLKTPSKEQLEKAILSMFCRKKRKDDLDIILYKHNRYGVIPALLNYDSLSFIIKLIKDNGHKAGHNFSWLSYFMDLQDKVTSDGYKPLLENRQSRAPRRGWTVLTVSEDTAF